MLIHHTQIHGILFSYKCLTRRLTHLFNKLTLDSKACTATTLIKLDSTHSYTYTQEHLSLKLTTGISSYTSLFKNLISHPSIINQKTNTTAHLAMIISLMDLIAYTTTSISSPFKIAQMSFSLDDKKGEHSPHGPIPSVLCPSFSTWTDSVLTSFLCFHGKPFKTMSFK